MVLIQHVFAPCSGILTRMFSRLQAGTEIDFMSN